jgi:RNA polymerase sigma-70 factor (ECF subfamily)
LLSDIDDWWTLVLAKEELLDFSDAVDRFRGPLLGLIVSWGAPHADALEIAYDSFADAYLKRESCRGDCQDPVVFGRWLRGVARNKFRNWRRTRNRRDRRVVLVDPATLGKTASDSVAPVDPRIARLLTVIDRLPLKQRQAIIMHYLDEASVSDVAALLSVTAKTVEGRLYQARRALRRMMDEDSPSWTRKARFL